MEAEFAQIDEDLVKLEAQAARASGNAKQRLIEQIEKLKTHRMELAAKGDIVLASGAEDAALEHEAEEGISEVKTDLP